MANSDSPHSSFNNGLHTGDQHNMIEYLARADNINAFRSGTVALQQESSAATRAFDEFKFLTQIADQSSSQSPLNFPSFPSPFNGEEGSTLAQIIAHHLEFNVLPEVARSPTNPQPPVVENAPTGNTATSEHQNDQNDIANLQRLLDEAIAFVHARKIPLLCLLKTAGCHNWTQLLGHLLAIAWKYLATERLQLRSSQFWEGELTRLYGEYEQRGKKFEEVPIDFQVRNVTAHAVTCLHDTTFTKVLTTFLASDEILRNLISRLSFSGRYIAENRLRVSETGPTVAWTHQVIKWNEDDQGFKLFHAYEHIPGTFAKERTLYFDSPYPAVFLRYAFLAGDTQDFFGIFEEVKGPDRLSYLRPLRRLNMELMIFGCSVLLSCLAFLANKRRGRADIVWKNMTITHIAQVTQFFRKVIAGKIAGASDDAMAIMQEKLAQLAKLELDL